MWPMTFLLPNPLPPGTDALLRRACFAGGYDQTPIPTESAVESGRLIISRGLNESGYLLVPWRVDPFGTIVTTTATLREREEPYRLLVELARGKLNQVRTQLAEWQDIGLEIPSQLDRELAEATRMFARAAVDQPDGSEGGADADALSQRVLEHSCGIADRIVRLYAEHMLATRLREGGRLTSRISARYGTALTGERADQYRQTFNAAQVAVRWRDHEPEEARYQWQQLDAAVAGARAAGLPITAGPVIDLSPGMLPDWITAWEGDLPALAAFMCDFLETAVGRYAADVRRWVVCAGFNHTDGLGLGDDDRLRLAARLFEAAAQIDPELELVVSITQPWGDYLVNEDQTISPLAFADDLVRAGLRVSAVELELRPGVLPRGSLPRDLLEVYRILDLFAKLQLPIEILLSHPTSLQPDTGVVGSQTLWPAFARDRITSATQAAWGSAVTALALAKSEVQAVTWDHWSDADPHLTPHGGLIDSGGRIHPLLAQLESLRKAYLA